LDLSYNQIEILSDDIFPVSCPELRELYLNNNRLRLFSAEYRLGSMLSLIRLDNNNLTVFPTSVYWMVHYLDEFNLSGNGITLLGPVNFKTTNRIYRLFLKNCSINTIAYKTFEKLHTLVEFDLSGNNLTFLEYLIFSDIKSLQVLNLSSNQITFIQKELFASLNRLTHLDLSNNLIQDIEDCAFLNLNSLKMVNLDFNPVIFLFKNHTFTGLFQLKHMIISNRVNFTLEIVKSIKKQIQPRLVRQVLYMKFYDSIAISFSPNFSEPYKLDMCHYMTYFIRNEIQLNLDTELYVFKFVEDCKYWSTDVYNGILKKSDNILFL
jgi:hypothetical protein